MFKHVERVYRPTLRTISEVFLMAGLAGLWLTTLSPTGLGGPVGLVWVSGTSMEPGLESGDLVVTYEREVYDVGDVVAFEIPGGGMVIHRVTELGDNGLYRFQGDNHNYEDPWDLPADAIIGRAVVEIHNAFVAVQWLTQPLVLAVIVALIVATHAFASLGTTTKL